MSAQQAGVLAGGQAFHIWGSRRRASGAWEKLSPRLSQLLRLLLNLRTGNRPSFTEPGEARRPPETLHRPQDWSGMSEWNFFIYLRDRSQPRELK